MRALSEEEEEEEESRSFCLHLNCLDDGHYAASLSSSLDTGNDALVDSNLALASQAQRLSLAEQRKEFLAAIEGRIWRVLGSQGRSEARLWFCACLGSLPVPRQLQVSLFLDLMRQVQEAADVAASKRDQDYLFHQALSRQVLHLACQKQPRRVMRLFSKDSKLIRSFFSGHPKRILWWFENFSRAGKKAHELGAQALAHFAFIHRDQYWNELKWRGVHGQAPATVAAKPHYFLDLDVLRTVENFLCKVPAFWHSDELWDSLKEGDILSSDVNFFIDNLCQKMSDESSDVWRMLESFFYEQSFSDLCQRLLSFVSDKELFALVNNLSLALSASNRVCHSENSEVESFCSSQSMTQDSKDFWLMQVLMSGATCPSLDCAIICSACIGHARQLIQIFKDEEIRDEFSSLKHLLLESKCGDAVDCRTHWALQKEGLELNKWESVKCLALESWLVYFLLAERYAKTGALKALLSANSITFQNCSGDLADQEGKLLKSKKDKRRRPERKRKRKKKRRKPDWSEGESLDSSLSDNDHCIMEESRVKWYLSTDNSTAGLDKTELPEHLASHAFGEWLKWASARW